MTQDMQGKRAARRCSAVAIAALAAAALLPLAARAQGDSPRSTRDGSSGTGASTMTTEPGRGGNPSSRSDGDAGGRSAGQVIDDTTISTRIKAAFVGDRDVKARDIQVETREGVVQLSGFADSRDEAEKAAEIAKATPGVKSVTNAIQMRPAASR